MQPFRVASTKQLDIKSLRNLCKIHMKEFLLVKINYHELPHIDGCSCLSLKIVWKFEMDARIIIFLKLTKEQLKINVVVAITNVVVINVNSSYYLNF